MTTLITGGAGYIGGHLLHLLAGQNVVVVDDFSTGRRELVAELPTYEVSLGADQAANQVASIMREHKVDSVVHFAASKDVGESVREPGMYYRNNVTGMQNLLAAMQQADVGKLVFSSSAATYGFPFDGCDHPMREDAQCNPISPYGETKLICEWLCRSAAVAWDLQWVGLRYFNVAGAGSDELSDTAALNLIPIVFNAISSGKTPKVFGDDYSTPDGTCIRDYIHVQDLAEAHVAALAYVAKPNRSEHTIFNIATGTGNSVLDVLTAIRSASGIDFAHDVVGRRAGDPDMLIADPTLAKTHLGWSSERDLADMVTSAWSGFQHHRAAAV